ncbi:ABC transporter ATP-binding protein [uncultured Hymenobacter sp.]|uniref:ABC transporter ATP-binding protein n=1 Tax=uncultured Hymenobacter sp. TaxID=170016 RepID=UPI0035CA568C
MLHLENISKQFGHAAPVLAGLDLRVRPGEILSLVGASGGGKSTLLRLAAGLELPTGGRVLIDGAPIAGPHPAVGVIFQEPRLMPWLTVIENVKFGLAHLPAAERRARAAAALARVGLAEVTAALPRQLSGGMAQRVAIARALVAQPSVLLLDEPFSALDPFTRLKLQDQLLALWAEDRPTLLLVTHDIEEALVLSDRVAVLRGRPGRLHHIFDLSELPRPRRRADPTFQAWKERLLAVLMPDDEPAESSHESRLAA